MKEFTESMGLHATAMDDIALELIKRDLVFYNRADDQLYCRVNRTCTKMLLEPKRITMTSFSLRFFDKVFSIATSRLAYLVHYGECPNNVCVKVLSPGSYAKRNLKLTMGMMTGIAGTGRRRIKLDDWISFI